MGTKTISITEEAYARLDSRKIERESFSDVINRLTSKKSLTKFAGILSEKSSKELEAAIKKSRVASVKRLKKTGI